jgi:hypothetical protein
VTHCATRRSRPNRSIPGIVAVLFTVLLGSCPRSPHLEGIVVISGQYETIPPFPWPPPRWTSRHVLPAGLVVATGKDDSLGLIFDRILAALGRAEIDEWSTYSIGSDGFAIATRPESIEEDGRPKPGGERWTGPAGQGRRMRSLAEYFRALIEAEPGRYRFMILVVTSSPVVAGAVEPDIALMDSLARGGAGTLDEELRLRVLARGGHCEALIYEYARPSPDDGAQFVRSSHIPAIKHLVSAGLWREEELQWQ